jgi:hypothetical protein
MNHVLTTENFKWQVRTNRWFQHGKSAAVGGSLMVSGATDRLRFFSSGGGSREWFQVHTIRTTRFLLNHLGPSSNMLVLLPMSEAPES